MRSTLSNAGLSEEIQSPVPLAPMDRVSAAMSAFEQRKGQKMMSAQNPTKRSFTEMTMPSIPSGATTSSVRNLQSSVRDSSNDNFSARQSSASKQGATNDTNVSLNAERSLNASDSISTSDEDSSLRDSSNSKSSKKGHSSSIDSSSSNSSSDEDSSSSDPSNSSSSSDSSSSDEKSSSSNSSSSSDSSSSDEDSSSSHSSSSTDEDSSDDGTNSLDDQSSSSSEESSTDSNRSRSSKKTSASDDSSSSSGTAPSSSSEESSSSSDENGPGISTDSGPTTESSTYLVRTDQRDSLHVKHLDRDTSAHQASNALDLMPMHVPPGQGKARTRRKNQKRREKQRSAAYVEDVPYDSAPLLDKNPSCGIDLPPGGGNLDLLTSQSATSPASASNTSLENIAERMLARTTVGHRQRRKQSAHIAPIHASSPLAQSSTAATSHLTRVPPPSMRPASEIPEGLTISSTDCQAWYEQQWSAAQDDYTNQAYEQHADIHDADTQEYLAMQRQVRLALAQEKQAELAQVQLDNQQDEHSLRSALPIAFGRPNSNSESYIQQDDSLHSVSDQSAVEHILSPSSTQSERTITNPSITTTTQNPPTELDYGMPEPMNRDRGMSHATSNTDSVLHRLRSLQAAVFGTGS
ncbi:hypothetical protein MPSI1_004030 [Malassezia psittaci]|uniref:Uncharacterized protein n=1 Tax=Malassezia psittaci TaxID=1821823 RepID=A0AAF0F9Y8_9BASI|nr:hypothetical protein MPSI1_004030 [Malassezia psittaci]